MENDINTELLKYKLIYGVDIITDCRGYVVSIKIPPNFGSVLKLPDCITDIVFKHSENSDSFVNISEIIFPNNLNSVNMNMPIDAMDGIKSIKFNRVKEIMARSFYSCYIENVSINSVDVLGDNCFECCPFLKEFDFSCVKERVGVMSFKRCIGLKSVKGLSKLSGVSFKEKCFSDCSALTELHLEGICDFEASCFAGCSGLKDVIVEPSVGIHDYCFTDCRNLEKVTIKSLNCFKDKITNLYSRNVFLRCYNIISIEVYDCAFDSIRMIEILGVSNDKFTLHKEKYRG